MTASDATACRLCGRLFDLFEPAYGSRPKKDTCWTCWHRAKGGNGSVPRPPTDEELAEKELAEIERWLPYRAQADSPEPPITGRRIELTPASAIRSERVRWLWRDRFPLRSLSLVAGEKGLGKSLLTNARVPAEATRGTLPGELEGSPMDIVVCTAEDDWRSVVKPRLMAHGADLDRVHRLEVKDDDGESLLTLPDDVLTLEEQIQMLRSSGRTIGMLVVDPIGAFLSSATDTHRDASVRRALAPLAVLADKLDLVVLVVAHLTKDESSKLINRVSGAGAFVNAARSVLVLAPSPDDPDGDQGSERVLVHVRGNWGKLAPTLAARVEARELELDDGTITSIGCLQILGECDVGVEDLQRGRDENGGNDVEEAIAAALPDGARPSRDVKTQVAADQECAKKTVERAAIRMSKREPPELIINRSKTVPPTTTWALPNRDSIPVSNGDSPEPPGRPFWKNPVPNGDLAFNRDRGQPLAADVPFGAQPTQTDPDADRLERIAERNGDLA